MVKSSRICFLSALAVASSYFPEGTDFLCTLNLRDNSSAWKDAVQEAAAAYDVLGDKLKLFEIGNEIDHFINEGWRPPTWDVAIYIQQWRNVSDQIVQSSCGISDISGAALWSVDYVSLAASIGMPKVYFHLSANAEYSSFVPLPSEHENERLQASIRSLYHGHYFMAHVLASEKQQQIAQIPTANTSDFSGYAIYSAGNRHHEQHDKVVLIDLQIWNSTRGLSNPSTLSTTDSTYHSSGQRPVRKVSITTCWLTGTRLGVIRLQAPGTNGKCKERDQRFWR
ncbi:glycoside hydrolase family 79 protein, partial [Aureobasidium melanogenum]